nr:MAG TPA: hypothetical protein [Caudoviricetes sp.]
MVVQRRKANYNIVACSFNDYPIGTVLIIGATGVGLKRAGENPLNRKDGYPLTVKDNDIVSTSVENTEILSNKYAWSSEPC